MQQNLFTKDEIPTVSPAIAKPIVVGSPFLSNRREIKFRAWDKKNKQIITYIPAILFEYKFPSISLTSRSGIHNSQDWETLDNIEMDLMQYTGLKDKEGKEIYEGDILELKYPLSSRDEEDFDDYKLIRVVIIFQSGCCWFTGDGFTDCNWHFYNSEDREIIGNVFENPELLGSVQ